MFSTIIFSATPHSKALNGKCIQKLLSRQSKPYSHTHQLTRILQVTIAYLIGFIVPVPLWLANRYYPHPAFRYINMSIIIWQMGYLFVGINSAIGVFFFLGFFAQWYLRKKRPEFFVKYNYIVSAALDGGTQVMVFILTFAVFGGSGTARPFP